MAAWSLARFMMAEVYTPTLFDRPQKTRLQVCTGLNVEFVRHCPTSAEFYFLRYLRSAVS
jgi:hypothetical protein